jgi:hypothetical protein
MNEPEPLDEEKINILLALMVGHDNRRPGAANVDAWLAQASAGRWTFDAARQAILHHYRTSTEYLTPAHVNAILDQVRQRIRTQIRDEHVCPPRELADDPRAEIAWRREKLRLITEGGVQWWAKTGVIPELHRPRPSLGAAERPELTVAVRNLAGRWSMSRPARAALPATRRGPRDSARMAAVRQELATRDIVPPPAEEGQ